MLKIKKLSGTDQALKSLKTLDKTARDGVRTAIKQVTLGIAADAASNAPFKTGTLRRSITPIFSESGRGKLKAIVGTNNPYAVFMEFGTRAHLILPVRKKALWWGGAAHPVKSVFHPGTKPYKFLTRAAVRGERRLKPEIERWVKIKILNRS